MDSKLKRGRFLWLVLMTIAFPIVAGEQLGYELTVTRLDFLQSKLTELVDFVNNSQQTNEAQFSELQSQLSKLTDIVTNKKEPIGEVCTSNEASRLVANSTCEVTNGQLICSTTSYGDDWIVIQQRLDGSVSFDRSWSDYRDGFGTIGAFCEFWWGLERIHQLTTSGDRYELLVELRDDQDEYRYAHYSEFSVDGESEKYRLAKLGGYSGTAGDLNRNSDWTPKSQRFSTRDSDNDRWTKNNCARYGGGWWYNDCGGGLNAIWTLFNKWDQWKLEGLHYSRMLIRKAVMPVQQSTTERVVTGRITERISRSRGRSRNTQPIVW